MGILQRFFTGIFPSKPTPPPAPPPRPNLLAVEGQVIDLNQLSAAELATLEAHLLARRQQRQLQLLGYLHELAAERARLLSADPTVWLMTLKLLFGEALGYRVATQDIGPGMQLQHLVLSRGQPDHVEAHETGVTLVYGDRHTGSYYDLEGDVITRAVGPPLAP